VKLIPFDPHSSPPPDPRPVELERETDHREETPRETKEPNENVKKWDELPQQPSGSNAKTEPKQHEDSRNHGRDHCREQQAGEQTPRDGLFPRELDGLRRCSRSIPWGRFRFRRQPGFALPSAKWTEDALRADCVGRNRAVTLGTSGTGHEGYFA
jgi:hypothetical protein